MKTLKFNHTQSGLIMSGQKTVTWRVNDEKNLSVDDEVLIVDKVDKQDVSSWRVIGTAKITEILSKHLIDIKEDELGDNAEFASRDEMVRTFRKYYGNDINEQTPIKIIHFQFTPVNPQPLANVEDENTTDLHELKLYADGGSRGNPGPSASGYALLNMEDVVIFQGGQYLGHTTNNQAEYNALKVGLQEAAARGARIVHVFMDSMLVINQMKGIYRVKHPELAPVYLGIKEQLKQFDQVTFTHVPREMNKLADSMVNETLDASIV